jgi:uncharacterized protein
MTTEPGKDYARVLLERADEALIAARTLLEKCLLADAISRAYYAVYYAAQSILYSNGLSSKTHSGTINIFGQEIVEKGIVPRKLGKILKGAHDLRQKADYSAGIDFELTDVEKIIEEAQYFLEQIRQVISSKGK